MQKTAEQIIIAARRPRVFVNGQIRKQPANAPACWIPTAMALMLVFWVVVKLKLCWKEGKVRTPPGVVSICSLSRVEVGLVDDLPITPES